MKKYEHPYQEQLGRVLRLCKALDQYSLPSDTNFEAAVDTFTNFFIQCYHVRDWLIRSGFNQKLVDNYIKNDRWLSICHDLANKQKHQEIMKYVPANNFVDHGMGVSTPISKAYDPIKGESFFGIHIWELHMPIDAITVANECTKSWQNFVKINPQPH